jgi:hypothetical protein
VAANNRQSVTVTPVGPQPAHRTGLRTGDPRRSPAYWRPRAPAHSGHRPHLARRPDRHRGSRPLLGQIAIAIELAVALTIIGTALFGSRPLSERAFRLLRWIANRPEPPDLPPPRSPHLLHAPDNCSASEQLGRSYNPRLPPRRRSGVQRTSAIRQTTPETDTPHGACQVTASESNVGKTTSPN